jgi:hypothetical protein
MHPFLILLIFLAMLFLNYELPYLYWIPNFIKHLTNKDTLLVPKQCSIKPLSILLTQILIVVKARLQMYCTTVYARSGLIKCGFSKIQKNYKKA